MLHRMQRHPVAVEAFFSHALVLTYACPAEVLQPLLPPGLRVDTLGDQGFVAVAMVQTNALRPAGCPRRLGQDFFLTGYRIFALLDRPGQKPLRGLRIIRSDTDRWRMVVGGNLLTHYAYRKCDSRLGVTGGRMTVRVTTPGHRADLDLDAHLTSAPAGLPPGSPFASEEEARHYAGPLPFTFDYERETHSIVMIKAQRPVWNPQMVRVDVRRVGFLDQAPFAGCPVVLATAFHAADVPYMWLPGRRFQLEREAA